MRVNDRAASTASTDKQVMDGGGGMAMERTVYMCRLCSLARVGEGKRAFPFAAVLTASSRPFKRAAPSAHNSVFVSTHREVLRVVEVLSQIGCGSHGNGE